MAVVNFRSAASPSGSSVSCHTRSPLLCPARLSSVEQLLAGRTKACNVAKKEGRVYNFFRRRTTPALALKLTQRNNLTSHTKYNSGARPAFHARETLTGAGGSL